MSPSLRPASQGRSSAATPLLHSIMAAKDASKLPPPGPHLAAHPIPWHQRPLHPTSSPSSTPPRSPSNSLSLFFSSLLCSSFLSTHRNAIRSYPSSSVMTVAWPGHLKALGASPRLKKEGERASEPVEASLKRVVSCEQCEPQLFPMMMTRKRRNVKGRGVRS